MRTIASGDELALFRRLDRAGLANPSAARGRLELTPHRSQAGPPRWRLIPYSVVPILSCVCFICQLKSRQVPLFPMTIDAHKPLPDMDLDDRSPDTQKR
jgi:hypothetical protein